MPLEEVVPPEKEIDFASLNRDIAHLRTLMKDIVSFVQELKRDKSFFQKDTLPPSSTDVLTKTNAASALIKKLQDHTIFTADVAQQWKNYYNELIGKYEVLLERTMPLLEIPNYPAVFLRFSGIDIPRHPLLEEYNVGITRGWFLLLNGSEVMGTIPKKFISSLKSGQFVLVNSNYVIIGLIFDEEITSFGTLQEATVAGVIGDLIMIKDHDGNPPRKAIIGLPFKSDLKTRPLAEGDSVGVCGNVIVRFFERPEPIIAKKDIRPITFSDIGGLDEKIEELKEVLGIYVSEKAKGILKKIRGDKQARGAILYGPPGCGKSMLAAAVSNETGRFLQVINGPEILDRFIGNTEEALREIFHVAEENSPSLLVIDEADSVFPIRGLSISLAYATTHIAQYNVLMSGIEKRKGDVFVLLATNRLDQLDPAVIRPGRVDKKIEIPAPRTKTHAAAILRHYLKHQPVGESGNPQEWYERWITTLVDELFVMDESTELFVAFFEHIDQQVFYFKHFVSGALLEQLVNNLEVRAVKRLDKAGIFENNPECGIISTDFEGLIQRSVIPTVPRDLRSIGQWLLDHGFPPPTGFRLSDRVFSDFKD